VCNTLLTLSENKINLTQPIKGAGNTTRYVGFIKRAQKQLSTLTGRRIQMAHGVAMEGSSVVLAFGKTAVAERRFVAANENGPKDPVKTVTVRRMLEQSGVAIKVKVPVTEFIGVAVATRISEDGVLVSSIELVHPDEELSYRVFEEEGNHNVVAEWQNWGKKLRLPLFIKAGDGAYMPYSQQVDGVMVGNSAARRKLVAEASRRPRFLNRRKPGQPGLV
jgi:hypothetical protein